MADQATLEEHVAAAAFGWSVLLFCDDAEWPGVLQVPLGRHHMALSAAPLSAGLENPLRHIGHGAVVIDARGEPLRAAQVLEGLRQLASDLPVLAVLSPGHEDSALAFVKAGANDFVLHARPVDEIVMRLRILRHRAAVAERWVVGDLALAPRERRVWLGARMLPLRGRQFDLLHVLIRHAGQVVSRAQIQAGMALDGDAGADNVIEVHVHHLRRLIGADRLLTVRGRGYRLVP